MKSKWIRVVTLLACAIILMTSLFVPVSAEGEVEVHFRAVLLQPSAYASCSVRIARFASPTDTTAIDSYSLSIERLHNWEVVKMLPPGYYQVSFASVDGGWNIALYGTSEMFEVRGDKMTVYFGVQDKEEPVEMPPEWLVYGEDTQNFYIWETEAESTEPSSPDTLTPDTLTPETSGDLITVETLPEQDTDVDIVTKETSDVSTMKPNTSETQPSPEEEQLSAKIGNYIYIGLTLALLVTGVILLVVIRKRRGA